MWIMGEKPDIKDWSTYNVFLFIKQEHEAHNPAPAYSDL